MAVILTTDYLRTVVSFLIKSKLRYAMAYRRFNKINPLNSLSSILVMVVILVAIYYVAKLVLQLLWFIAPLLFIASLFIDRQVFLGYVRWMGGLLQRNPLYGIVGIVLSLIAFPLLSVFFFGKALLRKQVRTAQEEIVRRRDGELVDYEEVDSEPMDLDSFRTDRPQPDIRRQTPPTRRDYDQFFE